MAGEEVKPDQTPAPAHNTAEKLRKSGLVAAGMIPTEFPKEFDLVVVNMDRVLFEGKAKSIVVPIGKNNLAVLPGHTPLFTKLDKGNLVINKIQGATEEIKIEDGIARITQLKTVVLVGF